MTVSSKDHPDAASDHRRRRVRAVRALKALSGEDRSICARLVTGFTAEEIAEHVAVPVATVIGVRARVRAVLGR